MKLRRLTSLTALVSLALLLVTSVIVYIVPPGRVAYWAGWRLWGLSKGQWGDLHLNLGVLFLVAMGLHIYLNWKPLAAYFKKKAKAAWFTSREFHLALAVCLAVCLGTWFLVPPFSWLTGLQDHFQDQGAGKYGEPPYGHAELSSLSTFTKKMNIPLAAAIQRLAQAGIQVGDPGRSLLDIAQKNSMTPQAVYAAMQGPQDPSTQEAMPENPPPGAGNLTLADLLARYDISPPTVGRVLKEKGLQVRPDWTIKEIARENGMSPVDVYDAVYSAVTGKKEQAGDLKRGE